MSMTVIIHNYWISITSDNLCRKYHDDVSFSIQQHVQDSDHPDHTTSGEVFGFSSCARNWWVYLVDRTG